MQLITYRRNTNPLDLFEGFQRDLNQLLGAPSRFLESVWSPSINFFDEKDQFHLKAELPGIDSKNIELSVQDDVLTLKGERMKDYDEEKQHGHYVERLYGKFQRSITLPVPVEADKIKASYKDGILDVVIPKKPEAKPHQIKVELN